MPSQWGSPFRVASRTWTSISTTGHTGHTSSNVFYDSIDSHRRRNLDQWYWKGWPASVAVTQGYGVFRKSDKCGPGRENERGHHGEKHLGEHPTQVETLPEKDEHHSQSY